MNTRWLSAGVRRLAGSGLNLLLPPGCMACDAPTEASFQLCGTCFAQCHFITAPLCARCGVPFAYAGQRGPGGLCPSCMAWPPVFGQARAALTYDTHSRTLLLQLKYSNRTELARLFAPMMARAGAKLLEGADWLVPVPLHRSRLRERGYNQAGLLASAIGRQRHIPVLLDGLQRPRRTPSLGEHDAASRADIMEGAITVRRASEIAGRKIVLVDDVMTSGATLNACAVALLKAGASQVDAVVAARVPDPELG